MTPEAKARQEIDQKLEQVGWVVQDLKKINLGAGPGVVVREYPTDNRPTNNLETGEIQRTVSQPELINPVGIACDLAG